MSDLEDRDLATLVINKIDDPIPSLSHTVTIDVTGEFFGAVGSRIVG